MKQDDVSVYGKILQLTSYRDFAYQTTEYLLVNSAFFLSEKDMMVNVPEQVRASKDCNELHVFIKTLKL